jgi:hypothetical protein
MKNRPSLYILIAIFIILPFALRAQGPGFGGDTQDTPIDGGVSLLVVAGAGYGLKKIRDARRKQADMRNKE